MRKFNKKSVKLVFIYNVTVDKRVAAFLFKSLLGL